MKKLALVLVTVALSCGSALSSFAAFVSVGSNDWKYQADNGTYVADSWIKHTDGKWYYLGSDAVMKKGWFLDANSKWFFLDANGAMQTGLIEVDGKVYFMNDGGDLFLGDKVVNGKSYNFGLTGSTNGTPYTSNKFNGNGTVAGSGNTTTDANTSTITVLPGKVTETIGETKTVLEGLKDTAAVDEIVIKNPVATSGTTAKVEVKIKANEAEIKENIEEVRIVAVAAVETVVDSADSDSDVSIVISGYDIVKSKSEIMTSVENLSKSWITEEMFETMQKETASISIVVDGVKVTYNISL